MIFQVAGALIGSILSFLFNNGQALRFGIDHTDEIGYAIISEVLGSFFLAFLYLTQTEEKTKLSKDPAITTLIIAASYVAALTMVSGPFNVVACLNPAIGFGASMQQSYKGVGDGWSKAYVFLGMPFVGSLIAVLFFEFVYKKVLDTVTEAEELDVDGILDGDQ